MIGYLHGKIWSSLSGNSYAATLALYLLDITYGAKPECAVDEAKIMPTQATEEQTESRWNF